MTKPPNLNHPDITPADRLTISRYMARRATLTEARGALTRWADWLTTTRGGAPAWLTDLIRSPS